MTFLALRLLLGSALKSVLAVLSGIPRQVWYAIAGLLAVLFLWHQIYVSAYKEGYDVGWAEQHSALLEEQQSHAVTRSSLNTANIRIADQNEAVDKLAAESAKRIAASEVGRKAAVRAGQRSEDHAQALDASSALAVPRDAPCVPSKKFLDLSGEL